MADNRDEGMEYEGGGGNKALRRMYLSAIMTTLALAVLILLLAQTVRHALEKEMVTRFGHQEATIAGRVAQRLDERIICIERSLQDLTGEADSQERSAWKLRALLTALGGGVASLIWVDEGGKVVLAVPQKGISSDTNLAETDLFLRVRASGAPSMGILVHPAGAGQQEITLGIPRYGRGGRFSGLIVAVLSWEGFLRDVGINGDRWRVWFLDPQGSILYDSADRSGDRRIKGLEGEEGKASPLREALLSKQPRFGTYRLQNGKSEGEKVIVAYAPSQVTAFSSVVATLTPYDEALGPVRKRSSLILMASFALIAVMVVVAYAFIVAARRRFDIQETKLRLREREEWQEKLLREKKTIEGMIQGSPIPTFVLDGHHKIILWNHACTELTGYTAAEMVGTEKQYVPFYNEKRPVIADLILERDFESIEKYYGSKKVKRSETIEGAYEARDFYRHIGGRRRALYFLAAPIYDEKGEIIAAIETIQDVSKEEELAKNLREYAETLQEELQDNIRLRKEIEALYNYLQSIVDSLPEQLYVLNSDGTIHYISRHVRGGIGVDDYPRKGWHFLYNFTPELRPYVNDRWEEAKRGIHRPFDVEVVAKDGSRRTLLITTGPIRGTDHYVVVERDVTDLKKLEARYYESQTMAAVGQLSAGIAHEVRNPLSSIKMTLQILEKRLNPQGNDLKRFRIAAREVEHLEKLVNDVLIFAKPSMPAKEMIPLQMVVDHALSLAEKGLLDKQVQVRTQFSDTVPPLEVDPAMLQQAFLNLILNACDAMGSRGELTVTIATVETTEGPTVELEIADNGCGIDKKDMPYLFNPFFTTKRYGTGLGLAQVKKIIELHQGRIELTSRVGEGTRVRIRFPLTGPGPEREENRQGKAA